MQDADSIRAQNKRVSKSLKFFRYILRTSVDFTPKHAVSVSLEEPAFCLHDGIQAASEPAASLRHSLPRKITENTGDPGFQPFLDDTAGLAPSRPTQSPEDCSQAIC